MRFGKKQALADCTLEVPLGSVTALIGPNGAGKTTLLHAIVGLLGPTEGSVTTFGLDPRAHPLDVLPRLGFVGQDHALERGFSVTDMLELGRRLNSSWDDDLAHAALREHEIPFDGRIARLSGGQRSQVALVLARAKRPELLVLDEPVAALDPFARREFYATLMQTAVDGCTVLLSSHLVIELERVCDYVIVLREGAPILAGSLEDIMSTHHLLVGPARSVATLDTNIDVIDERRIGNQATLLVRSAVPAFDSVWDLHGLSLEDIVLGYQVGPIPHTVAS